MLAYCKRYGISVALNRYVGNYLMDRYKGGRDVSLTPTREKCATVTIALSLATPSGTSKLKFW